MLKIEVIGGGKLPAGKYFIGDLSYILPWNLYQDFVCSFEHSNEIVLLKSGKMKPFHIFHEFTPDGDGLLNDKEGRQYRIDRGNLGIVELTSPALHKLAKEQSAKGYSHIIDFSSNFNVSVEKLLYTNSLVYFFGDIEIPTWKPEEEEEEEEEDYPDEGEDDY